MSQDTHRPSVMRAIRALLAVRDFRSALALVDEELALEDHPTMRTLRASILTAWGRGSEGVDDARAGVRGAPESALAHRVLGTALLAAGRAAEAEESLREAVLLAPTEARGRYMLGLVLCALGRDAEGDAMLDGVTAEMPEAVLGFRARVAVLSRRFDAAERMVRELLACDPERPSAHVLHARVLYMTGRLPAAADALAQALSLSPEDREARELLWRVRLLERLALPPLRWVFFQLDRLDPDRRDAALAGVGVVAVRLIGWIGHRGHPWLALGLSAIVLTTLFMMRAAIDRARREVSDELLQVQLREDY